MRPAPSDDEPDDLIPRAVAGEPGAVATLLGRYGALVYGLCKANAADPEDCYQDIWAKVLAALPRFDPNGRASLSTWLYRVAHNHLIDDHRKRRVRDVVVPLVREPAVDEPVTAGIAGRQRSERLRRALLQLPAAQRRAVVAHYLDELSVQQVAELEGVPAGTIKSRLHHGRGRLLEILGGTP